MPQRCRCRRCNLIFSVGWYHYHEYSSGYFASTLLVCSHCGVQHAVRHPGGAKGDARKPELLEAHEKPMFWEQPGPEGPTQNKDSLIRVIEIGRKPITELTCSACGTIGALVDQWPPVGVCPNCGGDVVRGPTLRT